MRGATSAAGFTGTIACAAIACALGSCGPAPRTELPRAGSRVLDVVVRYPSREGTWRPARLVRLIVRARSNRVAWQGSTDGAGHAAIPLPPDARWLWVEARVDAPWARLAVTRDALGRRAHRVRARVTDRDQLEVRVDAAHAGAFAALDSMLEGVEVASRWTHRRFPPLFAVWSDERGTSYSPAPVGLTHADRRYRIQLAPDDARDPSVVLHEVGHFVLDQLGATSGGGGPHASSVVVSPGLAWDEGCATWFSAVVRGAATYEDMLAGGRVFRIDLERRGPRDPPDRLDSEATVYRVLWDLSDGAEGIADDDGDGVALPPSKLLWSIAALGAQREMVPSLSAFLFVMTAHDAVRPDALARVLQRTSAPSALAVDRREDLWPPLIDPGDRHEDTLLGLDQRAPDGARTRSSRHVVRVRVNRPGFLHVRVSLAPGGDRDDLVQRVARNAGVDPSRAAPMVRRFVQEHGLLVSMAIESASGERLHAQRLDAGTHEHITFVRHPGVVLVSLRQLELVPARYAITTELDAL